ncbi:hypothetical protein C7S18_23925 (plasmid) [Ahniella affigens]|uniref:Uncharacterized protein n=1 Tax=Ahniella affigens TaxID=2021234 RepID=A0A2P1PZS9_9GAMM|nr:hypothetical protein [Ahniella affigens]AVQ00350.1 hypothetical protein C7S18_23925 [Ahniella affigens]
METLTETRCDQSTPEEAALTEASRSISLTAQIRVLLELIVDTMRTNGVEMIEMDYAGSGDSQDEFNVDPEFPGVFKWSDGQPSSDAIRQGTFYEMCKHLQDLVLRKNNCDCYEDNDGGSGSISVFAAGELVLDHRDYFTDSYSTHDEISLSADRGESVHVANADAPLTASASTVSQSQPSQSPQNALPMDITRVLAHSLSDLIEQLEGVGIALPGCTEGQWHGTEGLDFSDAYGALAGAKAAHLLP